MALVNAHHHVIARADARHLGDLEAERDEGQVVLAHPHPVDPHLRARMRAAEVEPDARALPFRGNGEGARIPACPGIGWRGTCGR